VSFVFDQTRSVRIVCADFTASLDASMSKYFMVVNFVVCPYWM